MHSKPRQLPYKMRSIFVTQYLRVSSSASYEDDDEAYYVDFLKGKLSNGLVIDDSSDKSTLDLSSISDNHLSNIEQYGLYYIAGWVVYRVKNNCDTCKSSICSSTPLTGTVSAWVQAIDRGKLTHPTNTVYELLSFVEKIFSSKRNSLLHIKNVHEVLMKSVKDQVKKKSPLPTCHNIFDEILSLFIHLRLHILAKDFSARPIAVTDANYLTDFSSRSAYMRTTAVNARTESRTTHF